MRYLGLDVHGAATVYCLLDGAGAIVERGSIAATFTALTELARRLSRDAFWLAKALQIGMTPLPVVRPDGLPTTTAAALDLCARQQHQLGVELEAIDDALYEHVAETEAIRRLMTIPAVAERVTLVIYAAVGDIKSLCERSVAMCICRLVGTRKRKRPRRIAAGDFT